MLLIALSLAAQEVPGAVEAASKTWAECLRRNAIELSASAEPAETVTTAAMGSCLAEQEAAKLAWNSARGSLAGDAYVKRFRELTRERLVALIMRQRSRPQP